MGNVLSLFRKLTPDEALLINETVSITPVDNTANAVKEMDDGDLKVTLTNDTIIKEGNLLFKKGLLGKWMEVDCKLMRDQYSVCCCNDEDKLAFTPADSWVSSRWNEKTGLFVLNAKGKSSCKLFLFETKSEDNLRQWLEGFTKAGWKLSCSNDSIADLPHTPVSNELDGNQRLLTTNDSNSNLSNTTEQASEKSLEEGGDHLPSTKVVDTQLDESKTASANEFDTNLTSNRLSSQVETKSISSIDDDDDELTEKTNAATFVHQLSISHHHTIEPLRVEISHDHVESGYCSKESLSPDVEKGFFKADLPLQRRKDSVDEENNRSTNDVKGQHEQSENLDHVDKREYSFHRQLTKGHGSGRDYDTRSLQLLSDDFDPDSASQSNADQTRSEKRPTVGHLFSQLKYRFAPNKRIKARKVGRRGTFGGHLLCNQKGTWKTMWFYLQDRILYAFRDIGLKPALMKINLEDSQLFCFAGKEIKDLGIFKILSADVDLTFAAWSQADYKDWMIAFDDCFLSKKCIDNITTREADAISPSLESEIDADHDDDLFADSVIPYEQAEELEMEQSAAATDTTTSRTSSETTDPLALATARSSVDSSNDGDESGLESSGAAWELRFTGQCANKTNESNAMNGNQIDERDQSESAVANHLESKMPLEEERIHSNKNTSYDEALSTRSNSVPNRNELTRPTLQQRHRNSLLAEMLRSQAVLDKRTNPSQIYSRSQSFIATRPRPTPPTKSVDLALHDRFSSLDSNDSTQSWDVLVSSNQKDEKDGRAETKCSAYSEDSDDILTPSLLGAQSPDLERVTRSDLLLRKHRNSLRLERDLISKRLFTIRDKIKHNHKGQPTEPLHEVMNSGNAVNVLEDRLKQIDTQLDTIDVKLVQDGTHTLPTASKTKEKRQKFARRHTTAHLFSKLRQPLKGESKRQSTKKNGGVEIIPKSDFVNGPSDLTRQRSLSDNHYMTGSILPHRNKSRLSIGSDEPLERSSVSSIESGTPQNPTPTEELDRLSFSTQGTLEGSPRNRRSSSVSTTLSFLQWKEQSNMPPLTDAMEKIEDFENFSALVSAQLNGAKFMYYSDV